MDQQMKKMDAMFAYWADPDYVVIPAGQTERIIDWLAQQDPDTWHKVAQGWNFDNGDDVLTWILDQDRCDRGTAAHVFLVEGVGHWLWDVLGGHAAPDDPHLCKTVLKNWTRYQTGDLKHHYDIPQDLFDLIAKKPEHPLSHDPALRAILAYEGTRDAESIYESQDSQIVIDFDHWIKAKGITLIKG
jgi:hypothetical protein